MKHLNPVFFAMLGMVLLIIAAVFGFHWLLSDDRPSEISGPIERLEYVDLYRQQLVLITVGGRCYGTEQAMAPDLFKYRGAEVRIETYNRPLSSASDCIAISRLITSDRIYAAGLESAGINGRLAIVTLILAATAFGASMYGNARRRSGSGSGSGREGRSTLHDALQMLKALVVTGF